MSYEIFKCWIVFTVLTFEGKKFHFKNSSFGEMVYCRQQSCIEAFTWNIFSPNKHFFEYLTPKRTSSSNFPSTNCRKTFSILVLNWRSWLYSVSGTPVCCSTQISSKDALDWRRTCPAAESSRSHHSAWSYTPCWYCWDGPWLLSH